MALVIATNNAALNAAASASSVNRDMETSMARLSSGKRINSASDDAAGVAISSRLSAEIRGTDQSIRNSLDGQALLDTAEGAHKEIENILQRMREVSVQAANDTNNSQDRGNLKAEMDSLSFEINRIASTTTWAGTKLMEDEAGTSFSFQVGAATGDKNQILVNIGSMNTTSLGVVAQSSGIGATNTSDFVINTDFNYQHHEGYGTYTDIVFKDTDDGQDTFIEIKGVTFTATFAETGGNAKAKVQTIFQKLGEYGANIDSSFTNFGYSGDEQVGNTYALNVFIGNESSVINNYITDGGIYSGTGLSMESATTARSTISVIDAAIQTVNIQRSELGAVSNRLNHTVNNLTNISSNLSAAKGGIEDADFAHETTMLAKNQILQQASTAMLAQANASKQNVLSLLQG